MNNPSRFVAGSLRISPMLILAVALMIGFATGLRAQAPEIFLATHPANRTVNGIGGGETFVHGYAAVSDPAGNTYVAGSFVGTTVFGTNSFVNTGGYGYGDIVLTKYSPSGGALWARRAGGSFSESGRALALDGAGGVYLVGMTGSPSVPIGTNVTIYGNQGFQTMFLARYDGDGNLLWASRGGTWRLTFGSADNTANVWPNAVAVDSAGNAIVAGRFDGNPMIGGVLNSNQFNIPVYTNGVVLSNKFQTLSTRTEDLFLAKFSAAGQILWATNHGSTNVDFASGLALDSSDNIYVAGAFNKFTTLGASNFTNSGYAPFLARFSPAGAPVWASNLSEPTNNNAGRAWSVIVDASNRVTVAFQTPTLTFRLGTNAFTNNVSSPSFSGVTASGLAQFDTNGTVRWMRRLPIHTDGSANSFGITLARDATNIFVRSVANLWTNEFNLGSRGLFLMKANQDGVPQWTNFMALGAVGYVDDTANELRALPVISLDGAGRLSVAGTITGDKTTVASVGWTNISKAFTNGFGYNQLLFRMESNYVAVAPQFIDQPTNVVFQPPQGITNSALARAWPAAAYRWYMRSNGLTARITNAVTQGTPGNAFAVYPTTVTNVTEYYCVASNLLQQTTSSVFVAQARLALYPLTNFSPIVLLGGSTTFSINPTGTTAFSYQWRMNGTNLPGANSQSLLVNYPTTNSGTNRYDVIVCNAFGCLTSTPPATVTVKPFGSIDPTFPAGGQFGLRVMVEPGGTVLTAGNQLVRYTTNGVVVTNGFYNPFVTQFTYPPNIGGGGPRVGFGRDSDGKIVVGGHFTKLTTNGSTGPTLNRMVRFNADSSIDTNFNVGTGPAVSQTGSLDNTFSVLVRTVVPLPDGKYLVGGLFTSFNGVARTNLVRLNNDGSVDLSFQGPWFASPTSPGAQAGVRAIAVRPGGGIVVAHEYQSVGGIANRPCIVGLTDNGAMDAAFNANLPIDQSQPAWGSFATGRALAVQPDGKIFLGGQFGFQVTGTNYGPVARFNADGTHDAGFRQTNFISGAVNAVALQSDGMVLFGGDNMLMRRVGANGTNDLSFVSEGMFLSSQMEGIAVDSDKIYVIGAFGLYRLFGTLPTTAVPQPSFSAGTAVRLPNGQFGFTTCGQPGQTLVIQASTNLVNWDSIGTNTVVSGCVDFLDTQAPQIPNRYYRVLVLP